MMQRRRMVKSAFFKNKGLFDAEQIHGLPLRFALVGLWTCCDREGRFRWKPEQLKVSILPRDKVDMTKVLEVLVLSGFVERYEYEGQSYGYVPVWSEYQYINGLEPESKLPAPPDSI